jgi:hypothetical protein
VLSPVSRALTAVVALLFAVLGAILFVAPGWAAGAFPWPVSTFFAMTLGAWLLGSAAFAVEAVRSWEWTLIYPCLFFVWLFGFGQAVLLLIHADELDLGEPLGVPYLLGLAVAAVCAVVGAVDLARRRPLVFADGAPAPRWFRVLVGAFVIVQFVIAVPLLDGYDHPSSVWPGALAELSAQAFSVLFLALALSAAPLVIARTLDAVPAYGRALLVMAVAILLAAAISLGRFDFGDHPWQLLYVGLYAGVAVLTVAILVYESRRRGPPRRFA